MKMNGVLSRIDLLNVLISVLSAQTLNYVAMSVYYHTLYTVLWVQTSRAHRGTDKHGTEAGSYEDLISEINNISYVSGLLLVCCYVTPTISRTVELFNRHTHTLTRRCAGHRMTSVTLSLCF